MIRNLGSFGVEPTPDEVDTFTYFGRTIRLAPDFGEVAFIDWMEEWGTVDETDPRATIGAKALMRACVHVDDFTEFWSLARANRQGVEQLLELVGVLVKEVTGRPTGQPSGLPGGQENTPVKSGGDSSSVVRSLLDREYPRADLANVVVMAQESQRAQQGGTAAERLVGAV